MDEQLVTFRLGKEEFGVDIMRVQEIIKIPAITFVPRAPRFIDGVINLRGNVIPVINLKNRFGMETTEPNNDARIIVIQVNGRTMGVMVDQVTEVIRIPENAIEPPPPVTIGIDVAYLRGVGKIEDRLIVLLELDTLLDKGQLLANA
ncbi:MAG TPA: chemotaxis protein CheW [Candidatus Deferrimicrobium sp.]|nr:chemotaxis protein CheW [Candidatus Deferrimicrobium sp.]